ncbi:Starch-binding associating with outer membrane [Chitinophaga costaii]|uniref:Starch-binding associating with outer membrane n=1 Tax=Chitinophaga costaii TaxID=1335309 RepID=A0A1C4FAE4_9BACT|nr:RagB/SusD family nutrient uptake outer membrane protein [Chitinophaga costaii]PUZ20741.1 RagB/SusD family nutrient uptake outer membrane protein [Chitinophaga costaii]SCC52816.1 Starch-binding associating with outer membrane [Chitinophaga costaii]
MKKIFAIGLLLLTTISCKKYLDQVPDDRLTTDQTFHNWRNAEQFLANVYERIPDEYGQRNPGDVTNRGLWTGGSDEADYCWGFVQSNDVNIGNWDATSGFVNDYWTNFYKGIRAASVFIQNADKISDLDTDSKKKYKAEARALRAMYYFYLMRLYGPVVLLGETPTPVDTSLQIPRSSFDECVQYVAGELQAAAADLPDMKTQQSGNTSSLGHITKDIALAFRANALMYNASPLFNGNSDLATLQNKDGKQLINQGVDASRWQVAAEAYRDFLTQFDGSTYELYTEKKSDGSIDPYLSCRNVILKDWNKEVIFERRQSSIGPRQYELCPYHAGAPSGDVRASGGLAATQNMVDAFFTANGRSIDDPQSNYVATGYSSFQAPSDAVVKTVYNQWVNREPRFYVNITYNNSTWLDKDFGTISTELFYSGNSGLKAGGGDHSTTGYIVRKGMGLGKWDLNDRGVILIRLAEIYLSYAECENEANPNSADAVKYLNRIRERAGIPQYGSASLPLPKSQDELRQAIRKERRVELAFENNRFFDVRRWKIAEQTENGPIYGLNINADLPDFLNRVAFENRVFNKRHYLFPIPSNDINNDKQLVQNPGW